jgi:hypothetical protein
MPFGQAGGKAGARQPASAGAVAGGHRRPGAGDGVVLLARIVRTRPDLASTAIGALDGIDHPRAAQVLAALRPPQDRESDES